MTSTSKQISGKSLSNLRRLALGELKHRLSPAYQHTSHELCIETSSLQGVILDALRDHGESYTLFLKKLEVQQGS